MNPRISVSPQMFKVAMLSIAATHLPRNKRYYAKQRCKALYMQLNHRDRMMVVSTMNEYAAL